MAHAINKQTDAINDTPARTMVTLALNCPGSALQLGVLGTPIVPAAAESGRTAAQLE